MEIKLNQNEITLKYILKCFGVMLLTVVILLIILLISNLVMVHVNVNYNLTRYSQYNKKKTNISSLKNIIDYPLRNFYIASSHNSYIIYAQNLDTTEIDSVKNCLLMGARVIELDLYSIDNVSGDSTPTVTHGIRRCSDNNSTSWDVKKCDKSDIFLVINKKLVDYCNIINDYAFLNTDDPLIITIENNMNQLIDANNTTAEIFKNKFGDRLYIPNSKYRIIHDIPLKEIIGKILLVGALNCTGSLCDITFPLGNSFMPQYIMNVDNVSYVKNIKIEENVQFNKKNITRIYPMSINGIDAGGLYSFNYDPQVFFDSGCQIVSMNYNTIDTNLLMYLDKFNKYSFILKQPKML